jgi:hypothetical protein
MPVYGAALDSNDSCKSEVKNKIIFVLSTKHRNVYLVPQSLIVVCHDTSQR